MTLVPSAAKKLANSQPMTPPPSTAMRFGCAGRARASRLVMTRVPSSVKPGGSHESAPVASRTCFAASSTAAPSGWSTATRPGEASRAVPRTISTPRPWSRVFTPPVSCFTTLSLRASIQSQRTVGAATSMPKSFAWRICSSRCAETIHALVGMQPQFRQVPPSSSFSTTALRRPSWAARMAAT